MRKLLPFVCLLLLVSRICAQPSSFQWPAAPAQDQKEQNPCNVFAAVGAVETWFYCLYGGAQSMFISKAHPYSQCGHANLASTTIQDALTMFQNTGVVGYSSLPWTAGSQCSTAQGDPYFGNNIVTGNTSTLYQGDCGTPYISCVSGDGVSGYRYRIAGFAQLSNIGQLTPTQLKLAIMNDGPIALNMTDPLLHGQTTHAYVLYGWNAQGYWLLTDSWPGNPSGLNQTKQNLDSLFNATSDNSAYYLTNSASYPAVWGQIYNSGTHLWTDDPATKISTTGCIYPAASNAFAISGPSTITTSGATYTVTGLSVLTNPTVSWSFESLTYSAFASCSPTTGTSTVATAARTGTGYVVASISRPNGLCEKIKYPVNVIGTNIPFTLTQTENSCNGGHTRTIQYQATSTYPLTCSWTLHPPSGGGVYTTTNGCTFSMDFTILPSSYGITMSVTSSALPGAADGYTTGGPAMACTGGAATKKDSLTGATLGIDGFGYGGVKFVEVAPNPASGLVTLRLPGTRAFDVRFINTTGNILFVAHAAISSLDIDVSRFPNGVYIVQTRDAQTGEVTVKKVLVQR